MAGRPEISPKIKVLDLFAGIGGGSLGLENTGGFETVAFCENAPYPQKILRKHWPDVHIYEDVTTFRYREPVDLVTAGFPCQDISYAGKGAGLAGKRSGLFWHVIRTLCLVGRPRLLLENVAALLNRGMGPVLGALAEVGYDAEWHCIPSSALGAVHQRDRLWLLANAHQAGHAISRKTYAGTLAQEIEQAGQRRRDELGGMSSCERDNSYAGIRRRIYALPHWLDRVGSCGNAMDPRVVEILGRGILRDIKAGRS